MSVADAAEVGAFFDMLRSVDLPQKRYLSLFDMIRSVDAPKHSWFESFSLLVAF